MFSIGRARVCYRRTHPARSVITYCSNPLASRIVAGYDNQRRCNVALARTSPAFNNIVITKDVDVKSVAGAVRSPKGVLRRA